MSTTVTYKGSTLTTVNNQTKTLTTQGKYLEDNITLVDVTSGGSPTLQNKTVTPTTSQQSVQADSGYDGLDTVTVDAMPSGTAGTPTATKGSVSNHSVSVTPSVTNTTGYITGSTKTGTAVTVSASELVSGSETKTANGTYDVTNLAQVVVNVAGGGGGGMYLYESKSCQLSSAGQTLTFTGLTANPHHFFVRHTGQLSLSKPTSGSYYYTTGCGKIVSTSTMLYTNYDIVGSSSAVKNGTNTSYPNFTWDADTNTLSVKTVANRTTAPGYFVIGTWVLHSFYEPTT